jgi:hypothetical protein
MLFIKDVTAKYKFRKHTSGQLESHTEEITAEHQRHCKLHN